MVMKIEKPCTENFSRMTKTDSGRHCASCNKTVVDFTMMSIKEIKTHLTASTGEVCGRFKSLQLEQKSGFEKMIFNLRACVSGFKVRPMRVACLALLSGIAAFTSSCMGKVQNDYDETISDQNSKGDPKTIKQDSLKRK